MSCDQPSQPRNVDLASLLADAQRLLRPTLSEQIDISSEPVTGVHLVPADPFRLMAAMLNLAILAREAMPGGGKLGFKAGRADLEISAEDFVMIVVSASGHGVAGRPGAGVRRPRHRRGYRQAIRRPSRSPQQGRSRIVGQNVSASRQRCRSVASGRRD